MILIVVKNIELNNQIELPNIFFIFFLDKSHDMCELIAKMSISWMLTKTYNSI